MARLSQIHLNCHGSVDTFKNGDERVLLHHPIDPASRFAAVAAAVSARKAVSFGRTIVERFVVCESHAVRKYVYTTAKHDRRDVGFPTPTGRADALAIAIRNAKELERQVHGATSSPIPVLWGPFGKALIYYPHLHTARWDSEDGPGPERFVARVAVPFLKDMWCSYRHLGSVPDMGHGSAVPEPIQKSSGGTRLS